MLPWAGRLGCISCLGSLGVSVGWLACVFQCTVCVLWRFNRLVVMGVSIVWVAYVYIFLDQRFSKHVHVAS